MTRLTSQVKFFSFLLINWHLLQSHDCKIAHTCVACILGKTVTFKHRNGLGGCFLQGNKEVYHKLVSVINLQNLFKKNPVMLLYGEITKPSVLKTSLQWKQLRVTALTFYRLIQRANTGDFYQNVRKHLQTETLLM